MGQQNGRAVNKSAVQARAGCLQTLWRRANRTISGI
jgi:hypothetical protein